jgi:hypothetical protein
MRNGASARSNVYIKVTEADGGVRHIETHNLVVDTGLELIRDLLRAERSEMISYIGFGHGTTAPDHADTTLEDEHERRAFYPTYPPVAGVGTLTYSYTLTLVDGVMGTLSEIGLLTAATAGTLYARATFAGIAKTALNTIEVTWVLSWIDDGV